MMLVTPLVLLSVLSTVSFPAYILNECENVSIYLIQELNIFIALVMLHVVYRLQKSQEFG